MGYVVGGGFDTVSMVGDPEVEVTGRTFTLDARRAEPVTTGVAGVATDPNFVDLGYPARRRRELRPRGQLPGGRRDGRDGLFAEPTDPVSTGQFEVELRTRLLPAGTGSPAAAATLYDLLLYGGRVPDPPAGSCRRPSGPGWPGHRPLPRPQRPRRLPGRAGRLRAAAVLRRRRLRDGRGARTRVEYLSRSRSSGSTTPSGTAGRRSSTSSARRSCPSSPASGPTSGGSGRRRGYGDRGADWMFVGVADLRDTGGHNGYPWEWSEDGGHPGVPPVPQRPAGGRRDPFLQVAVPATRASYRLERDLNLRG